MKRLTLAALMAIFALTAFAATASAAEPTKVLPEPTTAKPTTFTSKSPEGKLETVKGLKVKCATDKGGGSFTNANSGTGSVLFETCKSEEETVCTGVGDKTGTIAQEGTVQYLLALEMLTSTTSTLVPAFVFLFKQFHFTCVNKELGITLLVLARPCVAGKADGGEVLQSIVTVLFAEFTKGENKILSILPVEATSEVKCLLESSLTEEVSGEKFELAALIGTATLENWKQSGAAITVLLMNK
jgi:hypothetical protein